MGNLQDSITIQTDLFEHRTVQPHFINDCCFGEDLALWLSSKIEGVSAAGFAIAAPIQEDYGWGFSVHRVHEAIWVMLSFVGEGPTEEPGEWVVSVTHQPRTPWWSRLFFAPDPSGFTLVRDRIFAVLRNTEGISVSLE